MMGREVKSASFSMIGWTAFSLFVISDVLLKSGTYYLVFSSAGIYINVLIQICCVGLSFVLLLRRRLEAAILKSLCFLIAFYSVVIFQMFAFSETFGQHVNIAAVGQFLSLGIAVSVSNAREDLNSMFIFLFRISFVYVLFYIWAALFLDVGADNPLRLNDNIRGQRIFLAHTFAVFVLFFALDRCSRNSKTFLFPVVCALIAIYLSGSRFLQISAIFTLFLYFLPIKIFIKQVAVFSIVFTFYIISLSGMFIDGFNPFRLLDYNDTIRVRLYSYVGAIDLIKDNFFTGAGLPPDSSAYSLITWAPNLANSDLGIVGVWNGFGLVGLFLYLMLLYSIIFFRLRSAELGFLRYTLWFVALYSIISPFFFGPALLMVGIAVGILNSGVFPASGASYTSAR